mmetsp:Transcript_15270/g.31653  ORF Transcript_15270/g.31653 Transcript_15270/m.31653 type:complete len:215 (+) Transcript_15270:243-887(+)
MERCHLFSWKHDGLPRREGRGPGRGRRRGRRGQQQQQRNNPQVEARAGNGGHAPRHQQPLETPRKQQQQQRRSSNRIRVIHPPPHRKGRRDPRWPDRRQPEPFASRGVESIVTSDGQTKDRCLPPRPALGYQRYDHGRFVGAFGAQPPAGNHHDAPAEDRCHRFEVPPSEPPRPPHGRREHRGRQAGRGGLPGTPQGVGIDPHHLARDPDQRCP